MSRSSPKTSKAKAPNRARRTAWVYALLAALLFGMMYGRNLSGDVWWHLKTGQWIVQHNALPRDDPFSYTARNPIVLHEWGADIIEWLAYSVSPTLLAALAVVMISGAFAIAFGTALARSRQALAAFLVVAAGASASAASSEMRPQVFSFVLLALFVVILQRFHERGDRVVWLIPPLILLWVNLHAIFLVGLALVVLEIATALAAPPEWARSRRHPRLAAAGPLAGAAAAAAVLALVNPNGAAPYTYPFHVLGHRQAMQFTNEWTPPDLHEWTGISFAALLGLAAVGLASLRRRPALRDCVYVAVFAAAALRSQRNQVLFAIAAAGPIAVWLSFALDRAGRWLAERRLDAAAGKGAWVALAILVAVLFFWRVSDARGKTPFDYMNTSEVFPAAACDLVQRIHVAGPMYNQYNYGGYLIWRLWPEHKVFVDSRQEPFLRGTFEEEQTATNCLTPGFWQKVFRKHGINFAILNPDTMLAVELQERPEWACVYADDQAAVFVRNIPANARAIRAAGGY